MVTLITDIHETHGATFETRGGIEVASHYGRSGRAHRAVKNGVDAIEHGYDVIIVEDKNRVSHVDNAVMGTVPDEDGEGIYALLLDPDDRIETEMYVYDAGERLLIFAPRNRAEPFIEERGLETFLQRVKIHNASDEFGVFGVHGPQSTEKMANILSGTGVPKSELSSVRSSIDGELGVTIVASDNPTDEEGYGVVCRARDAENVLDILLFYGDPSVPVGYRTWDSLTAEAGTPSFGSEFRGNVPNVAGVRNALGFNEGCFVGQELISKIENRGRLSRRLVGFCANAFPGSDTEVSADGGSVDTVTHAVESPMLDAPISFALADYGLDTDAPKVTVDDDRIETTHESLPFVEGNVVSARLPTYPDGN